MSARARRLVAAILFSLLGTQCRTGYELLPGTDESGGSANGGNGAGFGGSAAGTAGIAAGRGGEAAGGASGAASEPNQGGTAGAQQASCSDGVLNAPETDVDCGGPECPRCPPLTVCETNADCQSEICTSNQCQAPSCSDAVKNGEETGADCGGPCPTCATGQPCNVFSDCQSGVCDGVPSVCQAASCNDNVLNGGESDVDCGGTTSCPRCPVDGVCDGPSDCASGVCSSGICAQPPTCTDSLRNGTESAVDCGGASCPKCGTGSTCNSETDCTSGVCNTTCRAATCNDGVRNATETGVDCGGSCASCTTPVGARVVGATRSAQRGATTGAQFVDVCPHDQVVIGFTGYWDTTDPGRLFIKRLQTVCGVLSVSASAPYRVSIATGASLPMRGTFGSELWTRMCPAGQVVTGFVGRSGWYIDQLQFECRPFVISVGSPGTELEFAL